MQDSRELACLQLHINIISGVLYPIVGYLSFLTCPRAYSGIASDKRHTCSPYLSLLFFAAGFERRLANMREPPKFLRRSANTHKEQGSQNPGRARNSSKALGALHFLGCLARGNLYPLGYLADVAPTSLTQSILAQ